MKRNEFGKSDFFRDIFSEHITKSFAAVYLRYNDDIRFGLLAKIGLRKSAGGIRTFDIKHLVTVISLPKISFSILKRKGRLRYSLRQVHSIGEVPYGSIIIMIA